MREFFRTTWVELWKDLRIWIRQPAGIAATFVPAIAFLLVQALGAAAVGRSPIALVTLDHGAKGQQMEQIFHSADVFRITDATPQQARLLFKQVKVIAIITIPANFTQRVQAHDSSPVDVSVNNLNLDFTNDVRRAVPDAITQFYQAQGAQSPIKVTLDEHNLRSRDVQLFEYSVLPTIVLLITISGLINGGLSTAREWETYTVKELLLAPVSKGAIISGKMLAGFLTSLLFGACILVIGDLLGWTQPQGIYWLTALLAMGLLALMSSGLGVAIGAAVQRIQAVTGLSINVSLYLFFLAGGVGVLAFTPGWLQNIATFIPLTYGRHALEMAVFYSSSDQLGRDVIVLAISTLVALGLGILSMRRSIAR
jgi:ABC-type multidrug transport system permease subunit